MSTTSGEQKIINLVRHIADIDSFRKFAEMAVRLKPYGHVCVSVGALASKALHAFPEGGSPWHEYTGYRRPLHRVFPHPKIEPHMPKDWVAKNRELVIAKSEILQELDLGASYESCDPFYLPDSFFDEYPHLRGPRVDHPARSSKPAFTYCSDHPEALEMVEWMVGELKKHVPGLELYRFLSNDS